ncbi:MAG: hypothetical protein M1840_002691 [Geoglossum simile]|nr:MAG: hypothetical protein M1840_002691 [Geoglossum simile]
MSATPEAMNCNTVPSVERTYGLHEWGDQHGNHGTELLSQLPIGLRAVRVNGLFEPGNEKTRAGLADYFHPAGESKRRVFVVVDSRLPGNKRTQIEDYFVWCKMEKLLENYRIILFAANETGKTLENVTAVVTAAKQFGIRRRDLFIAIGSTMVTDIVGFAAAIYRRSAPYISVPTDLVGVVYCHAGNNKVSINHVNNDGELYKGLFALSHLPVASFYDLSFLGSLHKNEIKRGLAEIVKIAVVKDDALFSYVEAYLEKMLAGTQGGYLTTAVELAARAASEELSKDPWGKGTHLFTAKFGDEAVRAIEQIKGINDDTDSVAIGVALMSVLSFFKGNLSGADLERVLNILEKAGLSICDETLEADALWGYMMQVIQERGGDSAFVVPTALGRGGCLNFMEISPEDIGAALNVLRKHYPKAPDRSPKLETAISAVEVTDTSDGFYEWTALEDVQYHVASVQEIFRRNNPTIIQNYCVDNTDGRKKKILVVVDDYSGNAVTEIGEYFKSHSSDIDNFCILSMHVPSKHKDTDSMLRVIDAAIRLKMSQRDLFVVIGGGTLMDIVGFAAAIYKGGTRYVKIPTTLLGMIDAGIAVKVGVNLGDHKNFIGTYFAPVACLKDPATFFVTLPQREFACGLAEAIKMAILKSPRLFELIARHHCNVEYNTYTHELIQIAIHTMLENLQPNLREHNLCRFVDFGHEFGHIVESLASYEIPHGECVTIGMAISTFLAHLKGILSQTDLERILYLILDLGLPIYVTDYDCCNPNVLWAKICRDGIENKHGMLYLVVPETIGRASFLDNISDIDAGMVSESVLGLRRYADWYAGRNSLRTNGFNEVSLSAKRDGSILENGRLLRTVGVLCPTGIYLPLDVSKTRTNLEEGLAKLRAALQKTLGANGIQDDTVVCYLPSSEWHITVVNFDQDDISKSFEVLSKSKNSVVQAVISRYPIFRGTVKGMYISGTGIILAQVIADDYLLKALRSDLVNALGLPAELITNINPWIAFGRILQNVRFSAPEARVIEEVIERELLNYNFGELKISRALGPVGQEFLFSENIPPVLSTWTSSTTTAAIIGASGDIGSQLADYLVHNDVRVICSIRSASLPKFRTRMKYADSRMRVLIGDVLDLANLQEIIQGADILFNMAGAVTLSSKPGGFAKVIALNGFAQGIITHFIQQMGRDKNVKFVYPSSQRVHLTSANASVDAWVQEAAEAFFARKDALVSEQDIYTVLERFAGQFIASHPLPTGFNVYEISKRLGEHFVSLLPRHSLARISGVYGPGFTRGFIYRAVNPKAEGNVEASEKRDFIYIDDVNELLLKAAQRQTADSDVFDGASGESMDLQEVWRMARELMGDRATVVFRDNVAKEEMSPDPTFARHLLGRDLISMRLGLRKTIDGYVQPSRQPEPIRCLQYPEAFKPMANEDFVPETTLRFARSRGRFHIHAGVSPITELLERSLNKWFGKLPTSHQEALTEYVSLMAGLPIRLRADTAMTQLGEFTIEGDGQHVYQGIINLHAGLATRACHTDSQGKIDDVVGHEGYHFLAFLLRGRKPLLSNREREQEEAMAEKWQDFLIHHKTPHVLAVDVGSTYLRIGILGPNGLLLSEPARTSTPSKQSYPQDTLAKLQERLLETIILEIDIIRASHIDLPLEEVGISFGAVITREGIVEDASILWADLARGYDFKNALQERLPSVRWTVLNDISAAAWRYKDEGRFCLITVSSGLSNKVFNPDLRNLDKLDLDAAGVGGEMGHVVVEPRAVDALVRHSITQATAHPDEFRRSQLNAHVYGDAQKINARYLGMAVKEHDAFALRLLEEADVPYCSCGNLADLCSYSSGRGALRYAKRLAARGDYDIAPSTIDDITDYWLKEAIATDHPLALKVLYDSTYPLALRILQLAADIGLDKFIIVGGFAIKTGKGAYLQALQDHLVRFCHNSAFFTGWTEDQVRGLVRLGVGDDNDGLIGVGLFVQHLRAQYQAVEKVVGERSLALVTRSIPRCGTREILAKVVFSGICTTDLQILRSERGLEPTVLGHEGVCQVLEVGKDVRGLGLGSMIVLNPNNPLDEHDKLGHTREGVFQQFVKFGQEFLERKQVLVLEGSTASATDTLIEPLSCVVAAQDRIKDRVAGKNVLVVGAGIMGLLFVLTNVKYGARNVFLANRSKDKLDFAVAKGIIQQDKVFAIGKSISSQVDQVSAGEGVDIAIITVSMGQGVLATQDAVNYVNAGGCVYLFAGFRPGDVLTLDGGTKADITSIRSGWKTERIDIAGKPVDLSGHRGSGYEDLAMAARLIRGGSLSFGRVISHIISLDVLPEIMLTLARGGNILGAPAKRVIVDMDARDRVVEFVEEFPLRHLHEATRKRKDAIPRGNLFREIGFENNTSMLGWVYPPAWQEIKATLKAALQTNALTSKSDFIFCGTGGWVFLVDALKEIIPASHDMTIHTLQSLDPHALVNLFSHVKDISMAVCLGISQSGRTLETVMLMNALRERFDSAGLDYREHFVWLTDTCNSVHDCNSGEGVIRASGGHDWENVDIVPLTVKNHSDINALFCAPHSVVMFLTLVLLLRKETEAVWHIYQQYLALRERVVHCILPKADSIASNHIEHIQVNLDASIAPAMVRLVTQLIAQGLGSKQVGFNPRVRVASYGQSAGFELVALPMPAETPAAVKVMLTMNALAIFVAMVAYHRRITFVTHPKVDLYKRKAAELMATAEVEQSVSDPGPISTKIIAYLNDNPRMRFVEIICYGLVSVPRRQGVRDWLASCLAPRIPSTSIDIVRGEEWNHSVYQAAVQTEDTLYVILVLQKYCSDVEGISKKTIRGNIRMLQAIARATYETLGARALYFGADDGFFGGQTL